MTNTEVKVEERTCPGCEINVCRWWEHTCMQCKWFENYEDGWCRYYNAATKRDAEACYDHFKW